MTTGTYDPLPDRRPRVVGVGEVLWDVFSDRRILGGAPANFAFHAAALGAAATIVSRVGSDSLGDEVVALVRDRGVETACIGRHPDRPTGTVSAQVDDHGKPTYVIHEGVAWDSIESTQESLARARTADAVCFGSLAQRHGRSRQTIRDLVAAAPAQSLRIFDVNLRQSFYSREVLDASLSLANVVKMSDDELPVLASMFELEGNESERLEQLAGRFELRVVALTRGGAGSTLWADGATADHPGVPTIVKDTIGAGDSFTATLALGFLAGHDLDRVNARSNRVAAWVCAHDGATPPLPTEYAAWFRPA